MEKGLLHLHNFLRWIILVLLVINIVRHFLNSRKPYDATDKKLGLWLLISAHINFVIGLVQYFTSETVGYSIVKRMGGFGPVMKDAFSRFWVVEHMVGMLIGIVLITIARGVFRKNISESAKHKKAMILYIIALVIIIAVIPWPGRIAGVERPLFPGK